MRFRDVWKHPALWLGVMLAIFLTVSIAASVATYDNFAYVNTNSANNVGTVTQAVASTTYGYHNPFYESWDCMHVDRCSFLLIHTGFVLYLVTPIYSLAPSALTLLIVQSVMLGLAAIPLYWLTRQVTKSPGKGLLAAGLYLAWAPLFSAFTLHLETLLPLELIGLTALWQARRYRWGLLAALAAFLTFEVAAIFVFLIGIFFLLEWAPFTVKYLRVWFHVRGGSDGVDPNRLLLSRMRSQLFRSRRLRWTLSLLLISVVAIIILFSFRNVWGYQTLGVSSPVGSHSIFSDGLGATPSSVSSAVGSPQAPITAQYWLIMFALVAFLPLLAPRSLVISLPWVGYTFLTKSQAFHVIGLEENTLIAAPIFIGVAYGLARVPWWPARATSTVAASTDGLPPPAPSSWTLARRRQSKAAAAVAIVVLSCVVTANLLLNPVNPALPDLGVTPGPAFVSGYFNHTLSITPGVVPVERLVGLIPHGATVAADARLFPLVTNHPNAFLFLPTDANGQPFSPETRNLPFDVANGPQFVLIESADLSGLSDKFTDALSDPSLYGLRGYVTSTAVGSVLLYQEGYSAPATGFGPAWTTLNQTNVPKAGLSIGPEGQLESSSSAPGGRYISNRPAAANTNYTVWMTPTTVLPAGGYTLTVVALLSGKNASSSSGTDVFRFVASGFGPEPLNQTVTGSSFQTGAWTTLSFDLSAPSPVPQFQVVGYALARGVTVSVASVAIAPA
jgi:uncharacterized membrane protein